MSNIGNSPQGHSKIFINNQTFDMKVIQEEDLALIEVNSKTLPQFECV